MEKNKDAWRAALLWLLDAYRAVVPVKDLLADMIARHSAAGEWLSLEFQEAVIRIVIHDEVADKYAPPHTYTCRFLKSYTDAIDRENGELSDALVAELLDYVARGRMNDFTASDGEQMHHVTYRIPAVASGRSTDLTVTCRVASVFNEVGLKIWEAGWFLAEFILAHRDQFEGRSVLELGAGVGFTGFVLAKSVHASRLIVSDYAPSVMLNLRYNTEINALEEPYQCPVDVETIDWENWEPQVDGVGLVSNRPDILLAGDCVYDVATFPLLVRVLHTFLGNEEGLVPRDESQGASQQPVRFAIFAATIRNQATFQTFLDTLQQHRISYVDITSSSIKKMGSVALFPYENRDQIRLCKLYRPVPTTKECIA